MMRKNNRGFTLLELLIAVSLSVVIFVILFAAMRLGYKAQDQGIRKAEESQKLRIIEERITWLIRGTYPFVLKESNEQKLMYAGRSDSIGFVTSSVDTYGKGPEDRAGLKWISIFTDSDGLKTREKVFFLKDADDSGSGKVYLLDPDVKKLEMEYFDIPEEGSQGSWVSEWDGPDKGYLPAAVKAKVTMEYQGRKIVMPEIIVRINAYRKLTGKPS